MPNIHSKKSILVFTVLFGLELVLFFLYQKTHFFYLKHLSLLWIALSFWFSLDTTKRKHNIFLISLGIALAGAFIFDIVNNDFYTIILLVVYMIEHQLYINIFRREGAKLIGLTKINDILLMAPLVLFCFIFFGLLMIPTVQDNLYALSIIYCIQLILLVILTFSRKSNAQSRNWMIAAIILLLVCDSLTSIKLFIPSITGLYIFIRLSFLLSKYAAARSIAYAQ